MTYIASVLTNSAIQMGFLIRLFVVDFWVFGCNLRQIKLENIEIIARVLYLCYQLTVTFGNYLKVGTFFWHNKSIAFVYTDRLKLTLERDRLHLDDGF